MKKFSIFILTHIFGMFDDDCPPYIRYATVAIVVLILAFPVFYTLSHLHFEINLGSESTATEGYVFHSQPVVK